MTTREENLKLSPSKLDQLAKEPLTAHKIPYLVPPSAPKGLITQLPALDESGKDVTASLINERPFSLYINSREVVTLMTIGDHLEWLALGWVRNQGLITDLSLIEEVEIDEDLGVIVIRTVLDMNFDEKLKKRTVTSGCAQGTVFGSLMDGLEGTQLLPGPGLALSDLYALLRAITQTPSLYLEAGAIHGCVLALGAHPLVYMEDVGRHNAVDKIRGYVWQQEVDCLDKVLFTTGRLTSEMVIKTVQMGVPILVSRSGFTRWAVDLATEVGLTMIGRARGRRFICLSAPERLDYDMKAADLTFDPGR